uniref:Uncharacterized protein n=1 Tax=Cucumis melo TaxID=3656 RepID=A0A9I9DH27_CUCME
MGLVQSGSVSSKLNSRGQTEMVKWRLSMEKRCGREARCFGRELSLDDSLWLHNEENRRKTTDKGWSNRVKMVGRKMTGEGGGL